MSSVESYLVKLKIAYEKIREDFNNQKEDLFLLKSYAQDLLNSVYDLKSDEDLSKYSRQKLLKLTVNLNNLINSIEHEIGIQQKEEHFNLKHTEF